MENDKCLLMVNGSGKIHSTETKGFGMWYYLLLFISGVVSDLLWALYIKKIAEKKKLQASIYSVLIGLAGIVMIDAIAKDLRVAPVWLASLFIGTYIAVDSEKFLKRLKRKNF